MREVKISHRTARGPIESCMAFIVQGRYEAAKPLYKRSLAIWEKALGPDHHRTIVRDGSALRTGGQSETHGNVRHEQARNIQWKTEWKTRLFFG